MVYLLNSAIILCVAPQQASQTEHKLVNKEDTEV